MKKENTGIFLILLLAFALRATGFLFGLPQVMHQDEPIVINHALAYSHFDLNPHFFKIPPLLSYLVFAAYGGVFVVLHFLRGISTDDFALWFFRDPTFFYGIARFLFGVVMGTASVYVLYDTGKRLFGKTAALWAALFFAVNYLHVRDSHYIYVDIPMIFSLLMVCFCLARHQEGEGDRHLWAAAVWVGIATAFKYVAVPIMLPVFLASISAKKKRALPWLAGLGILAAAVYFAGNFSSVLDFNFFLKEIHEQAGAETSSGLWHHIVYSLGGSFGGLGVVVCFAGVAYSFIKWPAARWVWAFPAVYFIFIALFSQPYERYAMPLIPFLCLGMGSLLTNLQNDRRASGVAIGVLFALYPLTKTVYLDTLLLKPDTRTEATRWIESNIPEGSTVALDHAFFSPNLPQVSEQIQNKKKLVNAEDPLASFKGKRFDLVDRAQNGMKRYRVYYVDPFNSGSPKFLSWSPVISGSAADLEKEHVRYLVRYRQPGEPDYFKRELEGRVKPLAVFSPYHDPAKVMTEDAWANVALPFENRELFSRKSTGPYLEIYELKESAA